MLKVNIQEMVYIHYYSKINYLIHHIIMDEYYYIILLYLLNLLFYYLHQLYQEYLQLVYIQLN